MAMEHSYCLAIEQLSQSVVNRRAKLIRMLFAEITRMLNHLLAISCFAMDTGALTPFLFAFEEREKLMEFYERVSGARMHSSFFRPGGIASDIPIALLQSIHQWTTCFSSRIDEIEELLTANRIFKQRLVDIGVLHTDLAVALGTSGILLRGCGIPYDVRKAQPYELYDEIDFDVPCAVNSDCYDRYLLRIEEMRQSLRIIKQTLDLIASTDQIHAHDNNSVGGVATGATKGELTTQIQKSAWGISPVRDGISRTHFKTSMEQLIAHFKATTSGFALPAGEQYCATEAPKGEFGVLVVTNGAHRCYRIKIKSPDYASLQAIQLMAKNHYLADLVAIIGSLDIVFGSIDR